MKRITFFIITVFSFIFASCQNKPTCDCESALFEFDTIPYSYKNYEIYPTTNMSRKILVKPGDSFVAFYFDRTKYMTPDTMSYLTLIEIRDSVFSDGDIWEVPVFKEGIKMPKFSDMAFYIKGVKKSEHGYKVLKAGEDIIIPNEKRLDINLNGEKYKVDIYHDKDEDNIRKNHIVSLSHNNITQCLIHVPKLNSDFAERVTVLFVGDADGDNKLDCIINVNTYVEKEDELYFQYLLYLSSEAEEGQLVKYVSKYTGVVPTMGGDL